MKNLIILSFLLSSIVQAQTFTIFENNKKIVNYLSHKLGSNSTKEIDFGYEALQRKIIQLDEFELEKYNVGRNEKFKLHKIEMAYPQRDLNLKVTKPLSVKVLD